jgi:hypothetical protein
LLPDDISYLQLSCLTAFIFSSKVESGEFRHSRTQGVKHQNRFWFHGPFIARIEFPCFAMQFTRSGTFGLAVTIAGGALLSVSFVFAYQLYEVYMRIATTSGGASSAQGQFVGSLNALLEALVPVMILAVMGWIGSIFLLRGVDFMKVDRGVGLVTFKVDRSVGLIGSGRPGLVTGIETVSQNKQASDSEALELTPLAEQQG